MDQFMIFKKKRTLEERRTTHRHKVRMDVNYRHGETYLFSRASNLSELGIFLVSIDPLPKGSRLELQFSPISGGEPMVVDGAVVLVTLGIARVAEAGAVGLPGDAGGSAVGVGR